MRNGGELGVEAAADSATMRSEEEGEETPSAVYGGGEEKGDYDMQLTFAEQQSENEHEEQEDADNDDDGGDDESWRFVGVSDGRSGDSGGAESDHRIADDLYDGEYGVGDEDGEYKHGGEEEEEYDDDEEEDDDLVHRSWSTERVPLASSAYDKFDAYDAKAGEGDEANREGEYQELAQQYDDASSYHRRLEFLSDDGYRDGDHDHDHEEEEYDDEEDEDGSTDEELLAFQFRSERSMHWTSGDNNGEPSQLQQRGIMAPAPTQQSMDRVEASVRAALSILNSRDSSSRSDAENELSDKGEEEHKEEEQDESHGDDQNEWKLSFGDDGKPYYYDIVHEAMEARWPLEFPADAKAATSPSSAVSEGYEGENQREDDDDEDEVEHEFGQDEGDEHDEDDDGVYEHDEEVINAKREPTTEALAADEDEAYEDEDQYHDESFHNNNVEEESDEEHADDEKDENRFDVSASSLASPQVQMQRSNFTLSNFSTVTEGEDEWQEAYTAKGRVYYYNRRTRESSWKKPENYVSRQPQKQLAFSSSFSSSRGIDNSSSHYNNASFYSSAASVGGRRASFSPETQDFLFCSFCGAKSVGEAVKTHFRDCSAQRFHRENQTDLYKKFEELLCLMSEDSTLRSLHYASSFPEAKPLEVSPSALTSYRESCTHASIQDSLLLLRRQRYSTVPQEALSVSTRELEHREAPQERPVHKRERLLVRMSSAPSNSSVRSSESSISRRKISVGSASEATSSTRSNSNSNNASHPKQSSTSGHYQESETCRYCGRSFAEGRLAKHEAVCPRVFGKEGSWGRGTVQTSSITPTASVSPYAKTQRGANFLRKKSKSTPIEKRNLVLSFKEYQATLVGCPVCKRRFAPSGAQQHIDICKSVQNRPRNPIRLMKDFAVAG